MADITIDDQIACVRREIAMRHRVYPRWVLNGKMKAEEAEQEKDRMHAVLATLQKVKASAPKAQESLF